MPPARFVPAGLNVGTTGDQASWKIDPLAKTVLQPGVCSVIQGFAARAHAVDTAQDLPKRKIPRLIGAKREMAPQLAGPQPLPLLAVERVAGKGQCYLPGSVTGLKEVIWSATTSFSPEGAPACASIWEPYRTCLSSC